MDTSALTQRALIRDAKKVKSVRANTHVKSSKSSNKCLYTKLSSEIDEHIERIIFDDPSSDLISRDHARIVLVKSGFIGHDVTNKQEIYSDEHMLDEIWEVLGEQRDTVITPQNLKIICGGIQGVLNLIAKRADLKYEQTLKLERPNLGFLNESGRYVLRNEQEKKRFNKKFSRL